MDRLSSVDRFVQRSAILPTAFSLLPLYHYCSVCLLGCLFLDLSGQRQQKQKQKQKQHEEMLLLLAAGCCKNCCCGGGRQMGFFPLTVPEFPETGEQKAL
ncbi:uncharacterized protein H6S33_000103 [Morchella sextelata]|jgi:hypothetical protein|uniref:uncharacterized protein n=1 Tax=Morchella sextelata TaxID=1174677 RepID=UPI001D05A27F|nr:uncharacterized protein H6S33_000103 [Morchella sextelata]KAH0614467.1 hypothetical protein H6S33_000103 [Morchella sextelata]